MHLAAALASAGLPIGTPASLATVDRNGDIRSVVSGTWPDGRAVTPADRFYAASLTKQVTGAALAVLVREGRVDADAPIATWLSDLPAWSHTVTPRQVVHHTAGLPAAGELEAQVTDHWTTATALAALRDIPHAAPGAFLYSNAGYILLAELVATVSGQSFAAFVADHFGLELPTDIGDFRQTPLLGPKLPLSHGDGGLWSSAAEFARWLHRQNEDEFGIEALVAIPGPGAPDYGWGIGVRTFRGHPLYIHGGEWQGASAKAVRCPSLGIGVVALVAGNEIERVVALVDAVLDTIASQWAVDYSG